MKPKPRTLNPQRPPQQHLTRYFALDIPLEEKGSPCLQVPAAATTREGPQYRGLLGLQGFIGVYRGL